jgi:hypothetical protein
MEALSLVCASNAVHARSGYIILPTLIPLHRAILLVLFRDLSFALFTCPHTVFWSSRSLGIEPAASVHDAFWVAVYILSTAPRRPASGSGIGFTNCATAGIWIRHRATVAQLVQYCDPKLIIRVFQSSLLAGPFFTDVMCVGRFLRVTRETLS